MSVSLMVAIEACSRMVVAGYEMDEFVPEGDEASPVYRVSCSDEPVFRFHEQEIEILPDGSAGAVDEEGELRSLEFYFERPMTEEDVENYV